MNKHTVKKHREKYSFTEWECPCGKVNEKRTSIRGLKKNEGVEVRHVLCDGCNRKSIYRNFRNTGRVIVKYTN